MGEGRSTYLFRLHTMTQCIYPSQSIKMRNERVYCRSNAFIDKGVLQKQFQALLRLQKCSQYKKTTFGHAEERHTDLSFVGWPQENIMGQFCPF